MHHEGISRGWEQRCRQYRFAASGREQRGQAGLSATLQSGHIHRKRHGAATKRPLFSNLNRTGDKEAALIHARRKTENTWTCKKKKNFTNVFKRNRREETTLLPLHGYCEFMVCCYFINLQIVSRCRESNTLSVHRHLNQLFMFERQFLNFCSVCICAE